MEGTIYQLALTDRDDGLPHPHVVMLTFSGNRDCIVVPAYSIDGFKVAECIEAAKADGLQDGQIFVKMDNSSNIDFTTIFPAKEAYWCTVRFRRLSQREVLGGKQIGQMKPKALREIAVSLLSLSDAMPRDFTKPCIKALRKLIKSLDEQIAQAMPAPGQSPIT